MHVDAELETGQVLAGQFRIRGKLGEGGMGSTYLAEQLEVERLVAIKVVHREVLGVIPDALERFKREARALAHIDHPNVVQLYTVGQTASGLPFLAMEFVQGETLSAELARGLMPIARAVEIARQVATALSEVHRRGVIHRDLKPANIMLQARDQDLEIKLVDFGIAKTAQGSMTLTATGAFFGTPQYVSPEQARSVPVDARTDLYSLGLVLYEMLTGAGPFKSTSAFSILADHVNTPPEAPSRRRAGVPAELDAIVLRCLEKQPEQRYPDSGELARELAWVAAAVSGTVARVPTLTAPVRTEALPRPAAVAPRTPAPASVEKKAEPPRRSWRAKYWVLMLVAAAGLLIGREWKARQARTGDENETSVTAISQESAPGAPQSGGDVVENDELGGLVTWCLNRQSARVLSSNERYSSWAGGGDAPRKANTIYGLYDLYEPKDCFSAITRLTSRDPTFKQQANTYAAALRALHPLVDSAHRYYDGHDYEDDHMQRALQMHQPLLAAFARFFAADAPFRTATRERVQHARRELLAKARRSGRECDASMLALIDAGDAVLELGNQPLKRVTQIDRTRFAEAVSTLGERLEAAERACAGGSFGASLEPARGLFKHGKQLRRRLEQAQPFTAIERQRSEFAAWTVEGSPARLAYDGSKMIEWFNTTALMRDADLAALVPLHPLP